VHQAWHRSSASFSITTAYRWADRFIKSISHLRSKLPPIKSLATARGSPENGNALMKTMIHLSGSFDKDTCAIAMFQQRYQCSFLLK